MKAQGGKIAFRDLKFEENQAAIGGALYFWM